MGSTVHLFMLCRRDIYMYIYIYIYKFIYIYTPTYMYIYIINIYLISYVVNIKNYVDFLR